MNGIRKKLKKQKYPKGDISMNTEKMMVRDYMEKK